MTDGVIAYGGWGRRVPAFFHPTLWSSPCPQGMTDAELRLFSQWTLTESRRNAGSIHTWQRRVEMIALGFRADREVRRRAQARRA